VRFEESAVVDGPPDRVFELTQDYARRLTWDPFLREAVLRDGATAAAVGVRAWCVSRSGIGMETEYVSFNPPRVAAVKMTRGPRVLESFAGAWEFEPAGEGRTRVTFRYNLRARPRLLAWPLESLARLWFARETRLRVLALRKVLKSAVAVILGGCVAASALASSDIAEFLGTWKGTSTCTNREVAPACKDETVVYDVVRTDTPGTAQLEADKVGELDFTYDDKAGCWRSEFSTSRFQRRSGRST
jgi:ribosome-associated toxin RatA of RatAB toxin-antitoxin module